MKSVATQAAKRLRKTLARISRKEGGNSLYTQTLPRVWIIPT